MDLTRLEEQLELLQTVGFTLNTEEKLRLRGAAHTLLESQPTLDEVKFWGRIDGLTKSYYIMLGLTFCKAYEFPHKTFFYSLSGDLDFKELPDLLLQHETFSEKFNAMPFTGDAARILVNLEGEGEGQEGGEQPPPEEGQAETKPAEEEDEDLKKIPKKNFTELNRLSYVVRAIENDVQVVPRDSFRVTPEHELRPNSHFYGLQLLNALIPTSWQHFRAPVTPQARKVMQDDMVIFSTGFLDTLDTDTPMGCWSVQVGPRGKHVTARSLLWPGYFALHRLGSDIFGGVYIGEGCKNIDLPFMI